MRLAAKRTPLRAAKGIAVRREAVFWEDKERRRRVD
jgi:hypothetical protein